VLGPVDDAYFRWVIDVGLTGADKGNGGKYLFVPPGYTGNLPSGYLVAKPPTYGNMMFYRAFVKEGDIAGAVKAVKAKARIYPLSPAGNVPTQNFVKSSSMRCTANSPCNDRTGCTTVEPRPGMARANVLRAHLPWITYEEGLSHLPRGGARPIQERPRFNVNGLHPTLS
jgi:hypothetical protein